MKIEIEIEIDIEMGTLNVNKCREKGKIHAKKIAATGPIDGFFLCLGNGNNEIPTFSFVVALVLSFKNHDYIEIKG